MQERTVSEETGERVNAVEDDNACCIRLVVVQSSVLKLRMSQCVLFHQSLLLHLFSIMIAPRLSSDKVEERF